jgi:hypothetical protein
VRLWGQTVTCGPPPGFGIGMRRRQVVEVDESSGLLLQTPLESSSHHSAPSTGESSGREQLSGAL